MVKVNDADEMTDELRQKIGCGIVTMVVIAFLFGFFVGTFF
jgi:hypothetical protein